MNQQKFILRLGCHQPEKLSSRDRAMPQEFDSEAEALAEFERSKKNWAYMRRSPWACSLEHPDGTKINLR